MVRLDKNKIQSRLGSLTSKANQAVENVVESEKPINTNSELEKFSLYVLKVLMDENIPTTPNNFQIYFDKLLENKQISFQKRINEFLEIETANSDEHRAKMEMEVKEGFGEITSIMNVVSGVYKNINVMEKIVKKRKAELEVSSGQLSVTNISSALVEDLNKLSAVMARQMSVLKTHYEKTGVILKEIESKAIFDSRFGVYNKRYLIHAIEQESKAIGQFGHKSSLVIAKIKDSILNKIVNSKDRMILMRNVSKLLLKTSRRSDVVAHYGDGIFAMVMKHTDIGNAQRACERISDLIYTASFFIGDTEMEIDIELAITSIQKDSLKEELITSALDSLSKTGKHLAPYVVCDQKEYVEKIQEKDSDA